MSVAHGVGAEQRGQTSAVSGMSVEQAGQAGMRRDQRKRGRRLVAATPTAHSRFNRIRGATRRPLYHDPTGGVMAVLRVL